MPEFRCAIVIPCFNEAARIRLDLFESMLRKDDSLRFCFVDDGSTDDTAGLLGEFSRSAGEQAECISLKRNQGKAEAVRQGLLAVSKEDNWYLGYWDADLATPLGAIEAFASTLDEHPELEFILGSRIQRLGVQISRRPLRHYLGRVFATCASLALQLPVYDSQCGAKLMRNGPWVRRILEQPFGSRWAFDVELLSRYVIDRRRHNLDGLGLLELPLEAWADVHGSKVRLRHGLQAFWSLYVVARKHRAALKAQQPKRSAESVDGADEPRIGEPEAEEPAPPVSADNRP